MNADSDRGVVTSVELMFVVIFLLAAITFVGFLGRLHAAGIQVTSTSQAAARAASLAADSDAGLAAAQDAVQRSTLVARCSAPPTTTMSWSPSASGGWQGGSVTVTVSCTVPNGELAGVWAPGERLIAVSDTQPIDRYKR